MAIQPSPCRQVQNPATLPPPKPSQLGKTHIEMLTENLKNTIDTHTSTIDNSAKEMQRQHQEMLRLFQEIIERDFQEFDQRMQEEIVRVIEVMGQQLASLSEKFVADYTPLTDKLRALLNSVEQGSR